MNTHIETQEIQKLAGFDELTTAYGLMVDGDDEPKVWG